MHKSKVQVCVYNMNKLVNVKLERGKERLSGQEGGERKERGSMFRFQLRTPVLGKSFVLLGPQLPRTSIGDTIEPITWSSYRIKLHYVKYFGQHTQLLTFFVCFQQHRDHPTVNFVFCSLTKRNLLLNLFLIKY